MKFSEYQAYFEEIINAQERPSPYDNPLYFDYVKLNWSRMNRWLKKGELNADLVSTLHALQSPQRWIVITEPWCGDAAHIVPFLELLAQQNAFITAEYELRDSAPFRINDYLTNGSKSIPKLIIKDEADNELAVWGPRPAECQKRYEQLKMEHADFETQKIVLQQWYNADQGRSLQLELLSLLHRP